ncbi:hypothetical protein RFI_15355 [Reticulomyxa filosa]|uniref:PITH domain-containing protein n=1 Tax=Reticulomyxa filosa TaxID=46433 RepID=X6N6E6_RETFI|nr:hypothetical protein RFI_15355 [Reticulomyxa filosa]|eukprot:ETO21850.1 hypothetical protein RFI_15355 [Reticulomyxa filosa]
MVHSTKQKQQVVGKIEEFDLGSTDVILFNSSDALNAADKTKLPLVMRPNPEVKKINSPFLPSFEGVKEIERSRGKTKQNKNFDPEVDEQLMIKLSFRDPVSITHLIIRADTPPQSHPHPSVTDEKEKEKEKEKTKDSEIEYSGPRMIKLFANKPELDFEDAEDTPVAQQLVLTEKDLTGEKLTLKSLKFQRCNSLQILIVDNQHDSEVTFLNRIGIIGRLAKSYHTDFES